jgi:hypothetical protein
MDEHRCDECGIVLASHVHLLPWCDRVERVTLTGDCDCDPGGYWFRIHDWTTAEAGQADNSASWTMRDQVRSKGENGPLAVAMVDARLGLIDRIPQELLKRGLVRPRPWSFTGEEQMEAMSEYLKGSDKELAFLRHGVPLEWGDDEERLLRHSGFEPSAIVRIRVSPAVTCAESRKIGQGLNGAPLVEAVIHPDAVAVSEELRLGD